MANDIAGLIKARAQAYALQQGMTPQQAESFSLVAAAIAYSESRFDPAAIGDNGASVGLFQLHERGRGSGMSVAQRQDPEVNIARSLPELLGAFRQAGAMATPQTVAEVSRIAQRPLASAWQSAVQRGEFANALSVAQGAATGGAPASASVGIGGGALPSVVNRTPVGNAPITSRFGTPFPMDSGATYQGQQYPHFNKGVDYGAAAGAPVRATVGGSVKLASDDGAGWGTRVVIVDQDGFEHSYGHLGETGLRPGERVNAGQVIGGVGAGQQGTSTGPHLSYDISKNGEPIDPSPWLGINVRESGIPASTQTPSYLSGQVTSPPGGTSMAQTSGGGGFFDKEISEAQWHLTWAQQRMTAIRNGEFGDPASAENQKAMSDLEGRIEEESTRLASAQAGLRTHQLINQAASGANPVEAATAVGGMRQDTFTNTFNVWKALMDGINMDATIKNNLSTLLFNAQNANISNTDAWVKNQIAMGNMTLDQAVAKVNAQAMQATAQAAYNAEELARGQWIDETTFRNFERRLPPGTTTVPGLGPNDALASATRNFGLQPTTLGVTPVDWEELRPERSLQRAGATLPPVQQFDTAGIDAVKGTIAGIQNPRPEPITASSINLQGPPNMGALLTQPPNAPDYSDLIAQIMASTAPSPPQQAEPTPMPSTTPRSAATSAPSTPNPQTGPEGAGSSARFDIPNPRVNPSPIQPGTPEYASMHTGVNQPPIEPGTPEYNAMHTGNQGDPDREAQIRELLKKFGVGAAGQVGAVASVGRRWLK